MGFLKNLFKKKPGGTFVGNLLRGVGDNFTGGLYSKINPVKQNADGSRTQKHKFNVTNGGANTPPKKELSFFDKVKKFATEQWQWMVGATVGVAVVVYFLMRDKQPAKRKGGRRG